MTFLVHNDSGPLGEIGSDLIEVNWHSDGNLSLVIAGTSPFIPAFLECENTPVFVSVDGKYDFQVSKHRYNLSLGYWVSYSELTQWRHTA